MEEIIKNRLSEHSKLNVGLVHVLNRNRNYAMNKDLNGGFGTADDLGDRFTTRILMKLKKENIRLPIISFAFLQALFKKAGHDVKYFEGNLPKEGDYDLILVYGTIVDYKNENRVCSILKERFPDAKIGIFGPFPSRNPELFPRADFVLLGESEAFFMDDFKDLEQLKGYVPVSDMTDMDKLPSPDYDGFPIKEYSYWPGIPAKPFLVLQASKGCPYSCRFYCPYGEYQGAKIRLRSPKKVVDDIVHLQEEYNVKGIQFRDPVFGMYRTFIPEFVKEMRERNIEIEWGMETRLDLLNEERIKEMHDVGLRNINVGIETIDPDIAKANRRLLVQAEHQERIIKYCKEIGVNISAFYILCYEGDTFDSVKKTVEYAIKLDTPLARFSISTPYPGTGFYTALEKDGRIMTKDFEKYTQMNLVYRHKNLDSEDAKMLLQKAYKKYYFRPKQVVNSAVIMARGMVN